MGPHRGTAFPFQSEIASTDFRPLVILTYVLCGTIGAFASRYLHREPGFNRFFNFYALFMLGMIVSRSPAPLNPFLGWELVGFSSTLLVAFFHERVNPVRNGLRVWSVYRIADAAFLVAAIMLHHLTGAGDFELLMGNGPWPEGTAAISETHAFYIGLLLLVAAAGNRLCLLRMVTRAMEGLTSSEVFYGSLRFTWSIPPLTRQSIAGSFPALSVAVVLIDSLSAIYGALTARVQCDVKSALAFASLTQVGDYRGGDRPRFPLSRTHSHYWPRLFADITCLRALPYFTTITKWRTQLPAPPS
ncbi:MAG: proton-conducting transporter membrane subunit [Planctomycetaceae bacterium]